MAETQYRIREKATGKEITCNWQNALELVNHGFWEWPTGNGAKEFKHAQREAKGTNPSPSGFEHLSDVPEDDDDDAYEPPAPFVPPTPARPSVAQIATTVIPTDEDGLEDMSRDELFAKAAEIGLTIDKRTGSKNLISAIRAATEGE